MRKRTQSLTEIEKIDNSLPKKGVSKLVEAKPAENLPIEAQDQAEARKKLTKRTIFNHIILFFTIGCIFGTYWEEIMHLVTSFVSTGVPEWESRRGLVYGPFSPVYGIGAVLIYLLFYLPKLKAAACFVGGAIFGGALEFGLSVLQEWIFGTISWDYSDRLLNICGRTTIPYMIVWGGLVMIFVQWVYPYIDRVYNQIQTKNVNRICMVLAVFLAFDISMSVAATLRQTMRRAGDPADTRIEIFLDNRFPDERMKQIYSNMREVE